MDAGPVKDALLDQVNVARFENNQEAEQHEQQVPAALQELDGPGVEERHFEVEDQEQHGDHVILDGITFTRGAGHMGHATFVGSSLDGSSLDFTRMQEPVCDQQSRRHDKSQNHENGNGKGSIENLNVRHSEAKHSKNLFASEVLKCKLYLQT